MNPALTLAWYYVKFLIFVEWLLYSNFSIGWVINSTANVSFLESLIRAYVWFENRKEEHLSWLGIKFSTILQCSIPRCRNIQSSYAETKEKKRTRDLVLSQHPFFAKYGIKSYDDLDPLRKDKLIGPSNMKKLKLSPCGETVCGRVGEIKPRHP